MKSYKQFYIMVLMRIVNQKKVDGEKNLFSLHRPKFIYISITQSCDLILKYKQIMDKIISEKIKKRH